MENKKSIILFIIGFSSALAYMIFHNSSPIFLTMILKTLPTISMCAWMIIKTLDKSNMPIFIGLILSLLCDVFMLLDLVTIGMAFNMVALVFYTIYFIKSDPSLDLIRILPFIVILTIFYLVLKENLGDNNIPALIYCILYIIFLWRSSARLGEKNISIISQWVCFLGCILIAGSDFLLSLMLFSIIENSNILYIIVMFCWWSGLFLLMITAELKKQTYLKLSMDIYQEL